ncbi:hypothetical protein KVT40_008153 [Elsinoe batatas]|uniref:Ankyrin repeat protein n=1 Tax=Elsinoe batatas TaxID=2601811 RepID=A0A8K0PC48_9PEZI|nr:hypothetical protein KVT40_008153 [Elsinoe batatas]
MKAAENGHKQIVELLLQHGANTETEGVDGPALQAATFSGYLDIVQMLVANGADLHNPDGRYGGPVQAAVHGDHIDILQYLVEQGADINMGLGNVRRWGPDIQLSAGPLQAAIRTNRAHMINWLLDHGADAYAHEETPLMAAVKYDNTGILNRLVKAGANVNKVSNGYQSTTCLYVAVSGGRTEAVRQLLSMGADPNCSGFHERYFTTTTVLTNACTKDDADIVRALLVAGANVHARSVFNDHDEPPLHSAAKDSKPAVISLLVAHGAKVNEQVHDGWSALHCAAQRENEATLRALISDHKADPKVSLINGSRPIHSAAASGSVGCIKALLEAGVDIDVRNGTGRTPLHWAIERRNVDAVKFLLERGAKKSVKERERGLTAKDMAEMKKREYEWDEKAREIAGLFE